MSFTDDLRNAFARAAESRAIRAIPPWDHGPGADDGDIARIARIPVGPGHASPHTDPEVESWTADAIFVYRERLAIAAELAMDTAPGSEAELIARREARRAHAGLPPEPPISRDGDLIDQTLEAFAPTPLTFVRYEPPQPPTVAPDGKGAE